MSQSTDDLKAEFNKSVALLRTLRDEVRVKVHLAGLDAKDGWGKLQGKLESAEKSAVDAAGKAAGEVSTAARTAIDDAVKALKEFSATLKK
jgi:hypothetical protein